MGGSYSSYNGLVRERIAKLDASTGALELTFDSSTGFSSTVLELLLSPDGNSLYAGGGFSSYKGTSRNYLAKISTTDASLDTNFVPSGLSNIYSMIYSEDQNSLFVGGNGSYGVQKVDIQSGLKDSSFAQEYSFYSTSSLFIYSLAMLSNNLIFTGGMFNGMNNGIPRQRLIKLNSDTTLSSDFDTISGLSSTPSAIKLSPDENYLYVATSGTYKGNPNSKIIKINTSDASIVAGFNASGLNVAPTALEISSDGNDIYVGSFSITEYSGTPREKLAKLLASDGSLDATFNPPAGFICESSGVACTSPAITSIILSLDESALFVRGYFSEYDGVLRQNLLKISTTDASLDLTFDPGATISSSNSATAIANSIDGTKLYVGNEFVLRRISISDGSLDPTFYVGTGFSYYFSQIIPHPDGNSIYVRGSFDSYKGIATGTIVKLRTINGGYMSQFVPEVFGSIIGISSDGLTFFSGQSQLDPITGASQ